MSKEVTKNIQIHVVHIAKFCFYVFRKGGLFHQIGNLGEGIADG